MEEPTADEKWIEAEKQFARRLEEHADLHSRISTLESADVALSRRITALENSRQQRSNDDPLAELFSPKMITLMMLLSLSPMVIDLIKEWRASKEA